MENTTSTSTVTFCSSVRNRPVWSILHPVLMSASEIQLQGIRGPSHQHNIRQINNRTSSVETNLTTHDFTFDILSAQGNRPLQILLLTPSSLSVSNKAETISRIEQFATCTDEQDVAIAFLLSENAFTPASRRCDLMPLLALQVL